MSTKILCVCAGNTCRSPMLEGLLREYARERERDFQIESAGLHPSARRRMRPSKHSVVSMEERGIDISAHRSRHIDEIGDLSRFDYIMVMEQSMRNEVLKRGAKGRVIVLRVNNPAGSELMFYRHRARELAAVADMMTAGVL